MTWNIAAPLWRHAQQHPRNTALVVGTHSVAYAELAELAARTGAAIAARIASSSSSAHNEQPRVGVLASRSIEAYAGVLGAAFAGAAYVPINAKLPSERVLDIIDRSGLSAVVVDARGSRALPAERASLAITLDDIARCGSLGAPGEAARNDLAYVMFTSGTTGKPKGVMIENGAVAHFVDVIQSMYAISPEDRVPQFSEISFDFSVLDLFSAWAGGAALHVVPDEQVMAPAAFMRERALTTWGSVPSVITFLSRMKLLRENAFPSVRVSFFCGEPLPYASALQWQKACPNSVVDNHYGPTEATVACGYERFTGAPSGERDIVAIGRAYPGMRLDIVDDAGAFIDGPGPGELVIHGPQVARGYAGDDVLTAARFPMLHHGELGSSRWYRTGDLARRDAGGSLHHLGRVDNQVKVLGYRVELEEIEAHLRAVAGSDAVAAVAWPVEHGSARGVVAFVADTHKTVAEIVHAMKARVPAYMAPSRVILVDALPLNNNGKVARDALALTLARAPEPR